MRLDVFPEMQHVFQTCLGMIPEADDAVARFEQEMQELEAIVAQMERGELRLEDSLKLFERGTALAKSCKTSLDTAELRVRNLLDPQADDLAP